jgi:hypothetical protein
MRIRKSIYKLMATRGLRTIDCLLYSSRLQRRSRAIPSKRFIQRAFFRVCLCQFGLCFWYNSCFVSDLYKCTHGRSSQIPFPHSVIPFTSSSNHAITHASPRHETPSNHVIASRHITPRHVTSRHTRSRHPITAFGPCGSAPHTRCTASWAPKCSGTSYIRNQTFKSGYNFIGTRVESRRL